MIYFFYGDDLWAIREGVLKLYNKFVEREPSIEKVILSGVDLDVQILKDELMSVSFFAPTRLIIVEDLLKNKSAEKVKKIIEFLSKRKSKTPIVFFENGKPDKRQSAFKEILKISQSKDFILPPQSVLIQRIEELSNKYGSNITKEASAMLSSMIPSDTLRLENELKKLSALKYNKEIIVDDLREMVTAEINPDIFDFLSNLASRQTPKAFSSLAKLIESGQNEIYLLTMIIWQFRQLIIISSLLKENRATATNSGINPYVFNKLLSTAKKYSFLDLQKIYYQIQETDYEIKTGLKDPLVAIEILAAKICTC